MSDLEPIIIADDLYDQPSGIDIYYPSPEGFTMEGWFIVGLALSRWQNAQVTGQTSINRSTWLSTFGQDMTTFGPFTTGVAGSIVLTNYIRFFMQMPYFRIWVKFTNSTNRIKASVIRSWDF